MRKPFMVEFIGTPEAGKTSSIEILCNELNIKGYRTIKLKESAERLPKEIPKGTMYANLWMHYQTQAGCLQAKFSDSDIVLIDRGLVDSNFYGKKFLWENICKLEEYQKFRMQFIDELFPDYVIALTVLPSVALQRRGGEGQLVTRNYLKQYNKLLYRYFNEIEIPKTIIDTSKLSRETVIDKLLELIENAYAIKN